MTMLYTNVRLKQIQKIIDQVNAYNNANESKRNYYKLLAKLSKTYFKSSDSLDLVRTDVNAYELTVVPIWCDNLNELKTYDDDILQRMFCDYYLNSKIAKPINMYQTKVIISILHYNAKTNEYDTMTLPQFLNKIKQEVNIILDYVNKN